MPKLKSLLPNLFGSNKEAQHNKANPGVGTRTVKEGRLETDALPIEGNGFDSNSNGIVSNTPTASTELTESVVRELSDPNYNSMEVVQSASIPGSALVNGAGSSNANNHTMNTMNVHSAQQQVVMNFSNASNLHFGTVYNFNQNLSANSSRKSSTTDDNAMGAVGGEPMPGPGPYGPPGSGKRQVPRKTTSIVAMMQSQVEPDVRLLDCVATHLGEGWKQVMRELGHSEGQIEQAIIDHQMHGNIKEVIYQLLLQWIRSADDGVATVGRLTTLLWEMQHRECVQRMKLVWKALEKRRTCS